MAKRKGYSAEQIIIKLREAEVQFSQGQTIKQVCRALEVSEQTYYSGARSRYHQATQISGISITLTSGDRYPIFPISASWTIISTGTKTGGRSLAGVLRGVGRVNICNKNKHA